MRVEPALPLAVTAGSPELSPIVPGRFGAPERGGARRRAVAGVVSLLAHAAAVAAILFLLRPAVPDAPPASSVSLVWADAQPEEASSSRSGNPDSTAVPALPPAAEVPPATPSPAPAPPVSTPAQPAPPSATLPLPPLPPSPDGQSAAAPQPAPSPNAAPQPPSPAQPRTAPPSRPTAPAQAAAPRPPRDQPARPAPPPAPEANSAWGQSADPRLPGIGRGNSPDPGRNGNADVTAEGPTAAPQLRENSCQAISYPAASEILGESGTVTVGLRVANDGHVVQVKLLGSSGFPSLDEAALTSLRRCRFTPARREGRAVFSSVVMPVTFRNPLARRPAW